MTNLPSAINSPKTFQWQPNEYIAMSSYFKHSGPLVRTKTAIKTAFTKSFESLDGKRYYHRDNTPKIERIKYFGVTAIYKTTGELIFERESPIMQAYALDQVTREEVIEAIDW